MGPALSDAMKELSMWVRSQNSSLPHFKHFSRAPAVAMYLVVPSIAFTRRYRKRTSEDGLRGSGRVRSIKIKSKTGRRTWTAV